MKQTDSFYPRWKSWAWRFVRAGVAGGVASVISLNLSPLQPDFSDAKVQTFALGAAFISGFISAAFLALRDVVSEGDKDALIQKLPV